jgi:nucleoside 2-deoxyribosyltransferase/predicted secreted protein
MYVLLCPCIRDPGLRADGITKPSDIAAFQLAIDRCNRFGIDMVPLPCPETLYLGPHRKPGTFLERLDTQEFAALQDGLASRVHAVVAGRGPPLCIIGVNSSPTCGATATWYGSTGTEPPKRAGRGVFLARFPGIRAVDVCEFARYRVYLAAPLFSEAERAYNTALAGLLRAHAFEVYVPQESGDDTSGRDAPEHARIYEKNRIALSEADMVVAVIDGADADSGTAWEMGYTVAQKKPVFALRTDFRRAGTHEHVNLMLEQSSTVVRTRDELLAALKSPFL